MRPKKHGPSEAINGFDSRLLTKLYRESEAARYGLSLNEFDSLLARISVKCLTAQARPCEVADLLRSLHLKDLALAHACAMGFEAAWLRFFQVHKSKLLRAASCLAKNELRARELADTLCSDLFPAGRGGTSSKLSSYTGRGSLENWLKAALAQANIDFYRIERRYTSFDEIAVSLGYCAEGVENLDGARIEESLQHALRQLEPAGRFMLAAHFLDQWNLAEIAAALHVHESTVSRRLAKALKTVRQSVVRRLRERGLDRDSIEEVLTRAPQEISFDLRAALLVNVDMLEGQS